MKITSTRLETNKELDVKWYKREVCNFFKAQELIHKKVFYLFGSELFFLRQTRICNRLKKLHKRKKPQRKQNGNLSPRMKLNIKDLVEDTEVSFFY